MREAEMIIRETQAAADAAYRHALAVPVEKVENAPTSTARSVLKICRELAQCPEWATNLIEGQEIGNMDENAANAKPFEESLVSVDMCREECQTRLDRFFECVRGFPNERLEETRWLPFNGGRDHTFREMLDYPRWNFIYHLGQIAYIQTIYGDFGEH